MREMKSLGVDKQGVQKTMHWYHFLGDGVGQVSLNIIGNLIATITFFYTDKVGLAAAAAGTVLLISKIIDAFADVAMGRIVDVTHSKFGKVRHWFLWMAIPAGIVIIGLFCVPAHASTAAKTVYALVSNILAMSVVYTSLAIPYGCMLNLRTRSVEERSKMGIVRAAFGYLTGIVIAVGLIPITNLLGGNQTAWIQVSVVLAVISVAAMFATFVTSKEENAGAQLSKQDRESENISLLASLKLLMKNKYWVTILFSMLFVNIIMALNSATAVYYAKYILHNDNFVTLMGGVGLIPVVIGFAVLNPMIQKFGLARSCRMALLIGITSTIVRCFFPTSLVATLIFGSIATFGTIPMMAVGGVLTNNTVDYNEWKFGKRIVGMTNSVTSFGMKIGSGLGAAMIGWVLAIGNYNGSLKVQPQSAETSILTLCIYLPFAFMTITYFVFRHYDLDVKYPQIVKELEERKTTQKG